MSRTPGVIDVDDTANCPAAEVCAVCGGDADGDYLTLATVGGPVGAHCVTLCGTCIDLDRPMPALPCLAAVEAVMAHCGHLGIDADQMASLLNTPAREVAR